MPGDAAEDRLQTLGLGDVALILTADSPDVSFLAPDGGLDPATGLLLTPNSSAADRLEVELSAPPDPDDPFLVSPVFAGSDGRVSLGTLRLAIGPNAGGTFALSVIGASSPRDGTYDLSLEPDIFDSIGVSPAMASVAVAVPEPGLTSLAGAGLAALFLRRRGRLTGQPTRHSA